MATVHILNVSPGDCTIIKHNSGRMTCIDICCGNLETRQKIAEVAKASGIALDGVTGNFRMCDKPSNPINYIKTFELGKVWRFILSHPDMDHMDGLKKLMDDVGIFNFWDTGARRTSPNFDGFNRYKKEDWDCYQAIISDKAGTNTAQRLAGATFSYANQQDDKGSQHDGLHILAPNKDLLSDPDETDDINESSYVIQYQTTAGAMLFPGDAHDVSWDLVMKEHPKLKGTCQFLLAPHHGRDSERNYEFLDFLQPKLTVLGCSPSKYIDYSQWSRRKLPILTSNQAGNIVLEIENGYYEIYVENKAFAERSSTSWSKTNAQGYYFWKRIDQ